jgi:hypothetical protein
VGRPYETVFAEFEGGRQVEGGQLTPEGGTGDVKYHHGAEGAYKTAKGKAITVSLSPNPSHLEFVSPVVDGRARAKQTQRRGREAHHDPTAALPVAIHGDAAFAAQGVVIGILWRYFEPVSFFLGIDKWSDGTKASIGWIFLLAVLLIPFIVLYFAYPRFAHTRFQKKILDLSQAYLIKSKTTLGSASTLLAIMPE